MADCPRTVVRSDGDVAPTKSEEQRRGARRKSDETNGRRRETCVTVGVVGAGDGGVCADVNSGGNGNGGGSSDDDDRQRRPDAALLSCDCRKKRCVDRYDSSESSDSGVAVLSCTDCSSGSSSTASSDITDPGSPFSTGSNHSEDSTSATTPNSTRQPPKMPPTTQTAHHPPWPWTVSAPLAPPPSSKNVERSTTKRNFQEKTALTKRLKSEEDGKLQSPSCLKRVIDTNAAAIATVGGNNDKTNTATMTPKIVAVDVPSLTKSNVKTINNHINNNNNHVNKKFEHQGKITEYFKSQVKLHVINKKNLAVTNAKIVRSMPTTLSTTSATMTPTNNRFIALVDQQTQCNGVRTTSARGVPTKKSVDGKTRKTTPVTVPRKILPAPSKLPDNLTLANFPPTVTLTAVSFPPNLAYLHTKTPKPPDIGGVTQSQPQQPQHQTATTATTTNIFVPQFIAGDKLSGIPLIDPRTTPCLNVIQPMQKITTINNFNCVKLNATVVPIVKLNAMPSRIGPPPPAGNLTLSVETAVPTILTAKPASALPPPPPPPAVATAAITNVEPKRRPIEVISCDKGKTDSVGVVVGGVNVASNKDEVLQVRIGDIVDVVEQKSPILSQPKTIRFPAVKDEETKKDAVTTTPSPTLRTSTTPTPKASHPTESGLCRWAECNAQFDTSGALLEHLQVKHVISQATQEHFVCLWLGCKVHGRTSCSRSWLERHVLAHAGTKPFRCIVDGCGQRFNSQLALERHVNNHFNADGGQNGTTKKSTDNASTKLFKRNGKKIRFRRQPWSARMFDFFDSGIMEGLQHRLLTMTQNRTLGQMGNDGDTVNVASEILARRVEADGRIKFLVKWHPTDVIPDEWVSKEDFVRTKNVPIPTLDSSSKDALKSTLFPHRHTARQKQRRKPLPKQT